MAGKKIVGIFIAVLGLMLVAGCSSTIESDDQVVSRHSGEYARQMALVKNLSKEADFTALRLAFTDTSYYSPYSPKDLKPMFNAMDEKNYRKCSRLALKHLQREFVSLAANYAAMVCQGKLGQEDASSYHRFVLDGLIESIAESGDGRSTDSAFVTISGEELYSFIRLNGLEVKEQSLIHEDGRAFDLMKVIDPQTDKKVSLYFDITLQMTKGMRFLQESGE